MLGMYSNTDTPEPKRKFICLAEALECREQKTGIKLPYSTAGQAWEGAHHKYEWGCSECNRPLEYTLASFANVAHRGNVPCYCARSPNLRSMDDARRYYEYKRGERFPYVIEGKWEASHAMANWNCAKCKRKPQYCTSTFSRILNSKTPCYCSKHPHYKSYEDWADGYAFKHGSPAPLIYSKWSDSKHKTMLGFSCGHTPSTYTPSCVMNGQGCKECTEHGYKAHLDACVYILHNENYKGGEIFKLGISNSDPATRYAYEGAWSRGWVVSYCKWTAGTIAEQVERKYRVQNKEQLFKNQSRFCNDDLFNRTKWNEVYVSNPEKLVVELLNA